MAETLDARDCRIALLLAVFFPSVAGYHLLIPFITTYEPIQVTLQTDQV